MQVFYFNLSSTCCCAQITSLNVHDFTEKTKTFYCPSGYEFWTKSKDLQQQTKRVCSLKSSCSWTMSNGCSGWENGSMGKWIMDRYFEVIIINLYSSEQKFNLWTISTKISTMYHACEYCVCVFNLISMYAS